MEVIKVAEEEFRFQGVYPALVTPFDENGVNEEQYRGLIEYTIKAGATGLVPCGTTGEFTSMKFEEKVEAIRIACEVANGRVPVLAGTGAAATADAIKLTRRAAEFGAAGALVVSPYSSNLPQRKSTNISSELLTTVTFQYSSTIFLR